MLKSLTIFFPCYNEAANVERVTRAALAAGSPLTSDLEVLIVNDGSRDDTGEISEALAAANARIRVAHNRPNQGYGGAVIRGLREARKEWVFYTDGDGQFDLGEIPRLIELLDRCDVAVGYRLDRADPLHRKINAALWNALVRLLFGLKVRDVDCAFKLLPRKLVDEIRLESRGALISTELLARAARRGYRIAEVGVHHYPRQAGVATGAKLSVIARAFWELFKLARRIRRGD
ncbi:MAG: glycosyltransferase family 2 protein [Phycisphaerae bacterium]